MAADTMCIRRRPMSLSFWGCVTLLVHVCGVSPALTQELQQPRALFVVNAPGAPTKTLAPAPAPLPVLTLHQKVVGAMRAAGTFGAISGALDSLTNSNDPIKQGITLFAPEDSAMNGVPLNSSTGISTLLNYQTAVGTFSFQDLSGLPVGYRIKTVTTGISILVVNNQTSNFQVDNAHIARPNLYNDGSVVVHGVDAIFETRLFNTATLGPVPAPAPVAPVAPAPLKASTPTSVPSSSTTTPAAATKSTTNHAPSSFHSSSSTLMILMASLIALMFLLSPTAL